MTMKRFQEMPLHFQQFINIHFCQKLGVTLKLTARLLRQVYGARTLCDRSIHDWYQAFQNGRTTIPDLPCASKIRGGGGGVQLGTSKQCITLCNRTGVSPSNTCVQRLVCQLVPILVLTRPKFIDMTAHYLGIQQRKSPRTVIEAAFPVPNCTLTQENMQSEVRTSAVAGSCCAAGCGRSACVAVCSGVASCGWSQQPFVSSVWARRPVPVSEEKISLESKCTTRVWRANNKKAEL